MREIKFRAWNKTEKWMDEDFWIRADGCPYQEARRRWDMSDRATEPAYDDLILEQYTGLKDKNGKEIYEGDILEYDSVIGNTKCAGLPTEKKTKIISFGKIGVGFETGYDIGTNTENQFTIIGNIHENSELL